MALYLPDHNALFVHAPKTGGTFVTKVLRQVVGVPGTKVGYKHSHKDLVGPLRFHKQPFTFSFVRHPLTWYSSYWQMKMRRPVRDRNWYYWQRKTLWHPNWEIDPSCGSDDFATWIRNVSRHRDFLHDMYRLYTGRGTRDEIDFVGKQERLLDDLVAVFDILGIAYDREKLAGFGRVNATQKPREATYDDELTGLILQSERRAIEEYGYTEDPRLIDSLSGSPEP